ncbi:MAG: hypothetical protein LBF26_02785 [Puniceicoccales bacterium]|jgi:hypothetical protein|nr:hypothetical protein [Puniceicoccales bacterium]
MKAQNDAEESELIKNQWRAETVIGMLKNRIGESFSRFRSWGTVAATVAVGILSINMRL